MFKGCLKCLREVLVLVSTATEVIKSVRTWSEMDNDNPCNE
jgi:hypothetical protein